MVPTSNLNQLKKLNELLAQRKNHVFSKLSPLCHHYYSELIPVNLFELKEPEIELQGIAQIMVRDGLLTLIDFFKRYPEPKNIQTRLLIHDKLTAYVPLSWKPQVKAYTYLVKHPENKKAKGLIIKGLLSDAQLFEEKIQKGLFKKEYENVYFMPSSKPSLFINSSMDQHLVTEKLLVKTWDDIKAIFPQVKIVTTSDIRIEMDFSDIDFYTLGDSGLLYTDDSTCLYLLARGSKPVEVKNISKIHSEAIEISPNHEILVSDLKFTQGVFENTIGEMEKLKLDLWSSDGYGFLNESFKKSSPGTSKWYAYDL